MPTDHSEQIAGVGGDDVPDLCPGLLLGELIGEVVTTGTAAEWDELGPIVGLRAAPI